MGYASGRMIARLVFWDFRNCRIRQRWPDEWPKIVAVTAYALQGDKEKCIEAGMDGYISKLINMEELRAALEMNSIGRICEAIERKQS